MDPNARVSEIWIYPVKALDGQRVDEARIRGGALENDRRWAMMSPNGAFINGKRTAAVHTIRSRVDLERMTIAVQHGGAALMFSLVNERRDLEDWLSQATGHLLTLHEEPDGGIPDDNESPGPTIISRATLALAASWFDGETAASMRARLRPNIVIDGVEAFWEDRLFAGPGERVAFRIGDVEALGNNPCQRCVVPSRDAATGEAIDGFQKRFAAMREAATPGFAYRARFNHYYRAAVNTVIRANQAGRVIREGDALVTADA